MFRPTKAKLAVALTTASMAVAAAPAHAQVNQEGLVNVALDDTVVQLPIGIAANVCNVSVGVLSQIVATGEPCQAVAGASANSGNGGNGRARQRGLVNVAATNTTIQVPIGVAANICNLSVGVIADLAAAGAPCTAVSDVGAGA